MSDYGKIPTTTTMVHAETVEQYGMVVSVCVVESIDDVFNISVSTIPQFSNHGYATDCVRNAVDWWSRNDLHLDHDLNWWVHKENKASIRIAENTGFVLCDSGMFGSFVKYRIPAKIGCTR